MVKSWPKNSFLRREKPASKISTGSATRKKISPLNTKLFGGLATDKRMIKPSVNPASTARELSGIHVLWLRCCSVSRELARNTPPSTVSSTKLASSESPSSVLGSRLGPEAELTLSSERYRFIQGCV